MKKGLFTPTTLAVLLSACTIKQSPIQSDSMDCGWVPMEAFDLTEHEVLKFRHSGWYPSPDVNAVIGYQAIMTLNHLEGKIALKAIRQFRDRSVLTCETELGPSQYQRLKTNFALVHLGLQDYAIADIGNATLTSDRHGRSTTWFLEPSEHPPDLVLKNSAALSQQLHGYAEMECSAAVPVSQVETP